MSVEICSNCGYSEERLYCPNCGRIGVMRHPVDPWAEVCKALDQVKTASLYELINFKDRVTELRIMYGDPNKVQPLGVLTA